MTWLIEVVAATADAEAIAGDLDEERRAIAARDGQTAASFWYWRQVLRTVGYLAVSPVRPAPLRFAALGLLGSALVVPMTGAAWWVGGFVVLRVPVYHYIPATSFWCAISVVPYLAVGVLSGMIMGQRAIAVALAVVMAMTTWVTVIDPIMIAALLPPERMPRTGDYLGRVLPVLCMYSASVVAGAVLWTTARRWGPTFRLSRVTRRA